MGILGGVSPIQATFVFACTVATHFLRVIIVWNFIPRCLVQTLTLSVLKTSFFFLFFLFPWRLLQQTLLVKGMFFKNMSKLALNIGLEKLNTTSTWWCIVKSESSHTHLLPMLDVLVLFKLLSLDGVILVFSGVCKKWQRKYLLKYYCSFSDISHSSTVLTLQPSLTKKINLNCTNITGHFYCTSLVLWPAECSAQNFTKRGVALPKGLGLEVCFCVSCHLLCTVTWQPELHHLAETLQDNSCIFFFFFWFY